MTPTEKVLWWNSLKKSLKMSIYLALQKYKMGMEEKSSN
jgi:hypothetical protein